MDLTITPKSLLLLIAAWTLSLSAAAQWQWIDKDGRKVFSDRPPTSDIKDKDILKRPGRGSATVAVPSSEAADTGAAPAAAAAAAAKVKARVDPNAPKISGKDAELQAKKKKLEEEAAVKKSAEDEKVAQNQAENCDRAKKAVATYQSGVRVGTTNAKGEREMLDDTARAAETKRMQAIVDRDCK